MLHMAQLYVGAAFWGRDHLTSAKISQSLRVGKGGWLLLGFTWSSQQLLQHYAKMRDPYEKRNCFLVMKSQARIAGFAPSPATILSYDLPQDTTPSSASISFPSFFMCMLWTLHAIIQRNFNIFIYLKQQVFVREDLYHQPYNVLPRGVPKKPGGSILGSTSLQISPCFYSLILSLLK